LSEAVRQPVYEFEGFRLDARRRVLFGADGHAIPLTPRLLDMLLYLVERRGELLGKEELLSAVWPNVVVEEHNLNKIVSELRRVLGEKPGEHRFIATKPGHGYRFVADVALVSSVVPPVPRAEVIAVAAPGDEAAASTLRWQLAGSVRFWSFAAVAASAVAMAVIVLGALKPAPEPSLRATPWTVEKGMQWFPVWSPDGLETAFATIGTSNRPSELDIRALDEPMARTLVRRSGLSPAITQWTSTGRILFFEGDGLWSVSPVGAQPERVVALDYQRLEVNPVSNMHVTRDGTSLAAFAHGPDNYFGIFTATPPEAPLEKYEPAPFVTYGVLGAPFLRYSPDGRQLLLMCGDEVWLMPFPPDASHPPHRVLENFPVAGEAMFSWLPDNRHVVISAGAQERKLYVADTRSGKYRPLTTPLGDVGELAVSPDGRRLLVAVRRDDFDIVTLDLETATIRDLIATDRMEVLPSWASAADALAYVTNRSGDWEIWLHRPPEADRPLVTPRDFPPATAWLVAPTLSPDGSRVIYFRAGSNPSSGPRLWMSAVAGGAPERLTDEEIMETDGAWSPDGVWYVFFANDGKSRSLKRVKTTGRAAPETLLEGLPPHGSLAPIWSPDGQWVLVPGRTMTLLSVADKTTRDLGIELSPCAFAATEPLLYCIRGPEPLSSADHSLVAIDFDGSVVRTIGRVPVLDLPRSELGPGVQLSPTPDRRGVTFSVLRSSQDLWMLDGLDKVELP
jgi:DNA-binding winged helix-turn-helix (wHTH) protein/Tol biopolymer transport system component